MYAVSIKGIKSLTLEDELQSIGLICHVVLQISSGGVLPRDSGYVTPARDEITRAQLASYLETLLPQLIALRAATFISMLPVACVLLLESQAICIKDIGTFPQCYWAGNALIRAGGLPISSQKKVMGRLR